MGPCEIQTLDRIRDPTSSTQCLKRTRNFPTAHEQVTLHFLPTRPISIANNGTSTWPSYLMPKPWQLELGKDEGEIWKPPNVELATCMVFFFNVLIKVKITCLQDKLKITTLLVRTTLLRRNLQRKKKKTLLEGKFHFTRAFEEHKSEITFIWSKWGK